MQAKSHYIGTTARSLHARSSDHPKYLRNRSKKNALVKHMIAEHGTAQPNFILHKIGSHNYNLHRQILEALAIEQASESDTIQLLNSRSEWRRAKLFRLRVDNSQGG